MSTEKKSFKEKLHELQVSTAVGKGRLNSHSKFNYRSAVDIIEQTRELRKNLRLIITPTESIEQIGDRFYVKVTLRIEDLDSDEFKEVVGYSREVDKAPMMNESQTTGSASSYAEKSALEHLFLLSDSDRIDPDSSDDETEEKNLSPEFEKLWFAGLDIAQKGEKDLLKTWFDSLGGDKNILGAANWTSLQKVCKEAKNGTENK